MLKMLVIGLVALVLLPVGLVLVVLLPLLLIGGALRLLVALLILPFKVLGALFGAAGAVFAAAFKGLFYLVAALFGLLVFTGGVVFLGFLPVLLIGFAIWVLLRAFRPAVATAA